MMRVPQIPFVKDGETVRLTGPVFLSCGCGNVIARWATVQQGLVTKLPQAKPKASKIVKEWIEQNGLHDKWLNLKQHQYGLVVAETSNGFEMVDVMGGATQQVITKIADLLRRSNEYRDSHKAA